MRVNADFSKRAVVHAERTDWVPSPLPGVDRRMLDRVGAEVARATSIVRYAPQSSFSPHIHDGGEEFLVLEGVFQDEHGDFPEGSYIRNPPSSSHRPSSQDGCVIFVKLWQFDLEDRTPVKIDSNKMGWVSSADREATSIMPLFEDGRETVQLERWDPGAKINLDLPNGGEFLVLEGGFSEGGEDFHRLSWLRLPTGSQLQAQAGPEGAKIWSKTRHLRFLDAPPRTASS